MSRQNRHAADTANVVTSNLARMATINASAVSGGGGHRGRLAAGGGGCPGARDIFAEQMHTNEPQEGARERRDVCLLEEEREEMIHVQ